MNVIDSSVWLEYFSGTTLGYKFTDVLEKTEEVIVPSITIFEVYKKVRAQAGENTAITLVAHMRLAEVADLTEDLALAAAQLSIQLKLPMADSIVLATARSQGATLWTLDSDFKEIPDVRYFEKRVKN